MSSQHLRITIRFIQPFPLFHGRGDAGSPEWPPSPMRAFQALLNAACSRTKGRPLAPEVRIALQALEVLRPQIIAPRVVLSSSGYRAYVPHNQADLVTAAWHRGNVEASIASHRMEKDFRPMRVDSLGDDLPAIHYLYPLDATVHNPAELLRAIRPSVRAITHLGWGIDQVIADVTLVDRAPFPLPGEQWVPSARAGRRLRAHRKGSLDALMARHSQILKRIQDGFTPPPPLTDDDVDQVRYRRSTDPLPRPHAVFRLVDENEDSCRYPHAKLIHVAGMVRHLAIERMKDDPPAWLENQAEWVSRVVRGKREETTEEVHQQFSYVPLPSVGHAHADAMIRNVMIVAPLGMERELHHLAERLDGLQLKPEDKLGRSAADMVPNMNKGIWLQRFTPPAGKFIAKNYLGTASVWETVTPVILDGHRKAKLDDARAIARTTERLIRKALARAGIEAPCEFTWQMVPFIKNAISAHERDKEGRLTGYFRPEYLQGQSAVHVRVNFGRRAVAGDTASLWTPIDVAGPITIGAGRHCGFGLFVEP